MKPQNHFFDSVNGFFNTLIERPLTKWLSIWGLVFFVLFLIGRIVLVYSNAADIGGIENNVIYNVAKMLEGGALYENPESGNFNITQYAPIYYQVFYGLCNLFDLHPAQHLHTLYHIGRALSLLFNLMGGFLLLRLLMKEFSVQRHVAVITVCLYFLNLSQIHFAARPDGLFNLIFIGILYTIVLYLQQERLQHLIAASILVVFAMFVKQNGIQFLILIPMFLMLVARYKAALVSFIVMIGASGLLFYAYQNFYGEAFTKNVFGGLNNGTSLSRMYYVFSHYFQRHAFIFIAGLICSVPFFDRKQQSAVRFLSFALSGMFLFAFVTSSKAGSWVNYYNEFSIAVLLTSAVLIRNKMMDNSAAISWKKGGIVLALILFVLIPFNFTHKIFEVHANHFDTSVSIYKDGYEISKELDYRVQGQYYFISFDPRIDCILPSRSVIPNKDLVPSQSRFDYSELKTLQESGQIKCIITPRGMKLPYSYAGISLRDYVLAETNESYALYKPGKRYWWQP